jgi:hypothetical protein
LLARAISVIKAGLAEQLLGGGMPVRVVGGEDTRDLSDESEAIAQLKELGARKWPSASEAQQFANAFTDPVNKEIANRAHKRPVPPAGGAYAWPR